jgi:hypothetical protein
MKKLNLPWILAGMLAGAFVGALFFFLSGSRNFSLALFLVLIFGALGGLFGSQFMRIWVLLYDRTSTPSRLAIDTELTSSILPPTRFEKTPAEELMAICEAYWNQFSQPGSTEVSFSEEFNWRYNKYVNAFNELAKRGPEMLGWARLHLQHENYDAREHSAFLIGQLGSRGQIDNEVDSIVAELSQLATRPIVEDNKEVQANSAAIIALGKIGHMSGIEALRHVLTASEWEDDDLQWDAVDALSIIVNESFGDEGDPVESARNWLSEHPKT